MWNTLLQCCVMNFICFLSACFAAASRHTDLVFPNETHLEGVPRFVQQPKALYYTMKDHPATFECVAEPVSHAVVECAEKVIPYKGPDESGRLKVIRLDSMNRPDPHGMRWHLELQIRAKEVEEWFDSYVCRCEVWNRVPELQRPKKVISKNAVIVEAYLERKFRLEPVSTNLLVGQRLEISCLPPDGRPVPQVYWMKNGKRIDSVRYPHIHIHGQTKLTIESTTKSDSGNYTCVADLLGLEFRYANAVVHVLGTEQQKVTEHPETFYWSHTREIVVSTVLLVTILLAVIVSLAIVAVRKKQLKPSFKNWLFTPCCLPASRSFHKEHNGVNSQAPLLLDEYKQAWLLRNGATVYTGKEAYSTETRNNAVSPYGLAHVFTNRHTGPIQGNVLQLKAGIYETLEPRVESHRPTLFYSNTNHRHTSDSIRTLVPPPPSVPPPPPLTLELPRSASSLGSWMDSIPSTNYFFSGLQSQRSTKCSIVPNADVHPPQYTQVGFTQIQPDCQLSNHNSDFKVHFPPPLEAQLSASTLMNPKSSSEGPSSASNTNTTAISSGKEDDLSESPRLQSISRKDVPNLEGTVYDVCLSDQDIEGKNRSRTFETDSPSCPSNAQGRINNTGGTLQIEQCAVQLSIPPGAIEGRIGADVSLTVYHQDRDKPTLKKHQTLLSPVVEFGPKQLRLSAPAIVTLPHCANLKQGGWRVRVLALELPTQECDGCSAGCALHNHSFVDVQSNEPDYSSTHGTTLQRAQWKEVLVLDEELHCYKQTQALQQDALIGPIGYQLDTTTLHLVSRKPQRYCLIGETVGCRMTRSLFERDTRLQNSENNNPPSYKMTTEPDKLYSGASKFLQLAAFSVPITPSTVEYNTRVYVLPDTPDALNHVTELERLSDGHLVDHIKQFPFMDNGTGITFQITDVTSGWRSRLQTEKQEIPFRHIWNGTQTSTLHCSFSLENIDPTQCCISWKIIFYQGCPRSGEWSLSLPKT